MKINNSFVDILGLFFFAYGAFAMSFAVFRGKPDWVLWFCYVGMILIGLGLLFRQPVLIASQLNLVVIPLIFWLVDFGYLATTGKTLYGITNYFFSELLWPARLISLEHFFLVPLGFLTLYLVKLKKGQGKVSLIISLAEAAGLYFLSRFFTSVNYNVNCVHTSCFPSVPTDTWYPWRWFMIVYLMILITHLIYFKMPFFEKNKVRSNKVVK
ncbi:MAG: hypothetical protein A2729_02425 [Candidatus Buchananbacteria bacterium RIFCSPHIGHO2_01_FULL_39_14]|uniref:Uncharacterized protein n=1 Tax=Candidatus Buchananbacteria bacterium RIFCSPHIGHO2_01_FULL_39_14 TaxID=1797532 RepID=A0A1G1XUK2_9BACT|nr:MAG: hypothetical protein A2729_02425 [Candidatus Buchananbacteria bacterium RIFCSPHIGHO2_01_FULL_39_14]